MITLSVIIAVCSLIVLLSCLYWRFKKQQKQSDTAFLAGICLMSVSAAFRLDWLIFGLYALFAVLEGRQYYKTYYKTYCKNSSCKEEMVGETFNRDDLP